MIVINHNCKELEMILMIYSAIEIPYVQYCNIHFRRTSRVQLMHTRAILIDTQSFSGIDYCELVSVE